MPENEVALRITATGGRAAAGEVGALDKALTQMNQRLQRIAEQGAPAASRQLSAMEKQAQRTRASMTALREVSSGLAVAGAALGGGLALSAKSAMQFDEALRNVNSIAQLSDKQFQALRSEVLGFTSDPSIRQGPTDLAKGLYEVYSSGFEGAKALDILQVSAQGASAGLTDTATSSRVLMAVLNSGIRGVSSAKEAMDVLFQEVNLGVNSFEGLANQLGDTLPLATAAGVSLQEVTAALATLTRQGINIAEANTAVIQLLTHIVRPSEEAKRAMDALGISYGMGAIEAKGLAGWLKELTERTHGDREAMVRLMPEIRAMKALLGLTTNEGRLFAEMLKGMGHATEGVGQTQKALSEQMKSSAYQWDLFMKKLEDLRVKVGTAVLPTVNRLTDGLGNLATKFSELPQPTQDAIVQIATLGTAALVTAGGMATLIARIAELRTALNALGVSKVFAWLRKVGALGGWGGVAGLGLAALIKMAKDAGDYYNLKPQKSDIPEATEYLSRVMAGAAQLPSHFPWAPRNRDWNALSPVARRLIEDKARFERRRSIWELTPGQVHGIYQELREGKLAKVPGLGSGPRDRKPFQQDKRGLESFPVRPTTPDNDPYHPKRQKIDLDQLIKNEKARQKALVNASKAAKQAANDPYRPKRQKINLDQLIKNEKARQKVLVNARKAVQQAAKEHADYVSFMSFVQEAATEAIDDETQREIQRRRNTLAEDIKRAKGNPAVIANLRKAAERDIAQIQEQAAERRRRAAVESLEDTRKLNEALQEGLRLRLEELQAMERGNSSQDHQLSLLQEQLAVIEKLRQLAQTPRERHQAGLEALQVHTALREVQRTYRGAGNLSPPEWAQVGPDSERLVEEQRDRAFEEMTRARVLAEIQHRQSYLPLDVGDVGPDSEAMARSGYGPSDWNRERSRRWDTRLGLAAFREQWERSQTWSAAARVADLRDELTRTLGLGERYSDLTSPDDRAEVNKELKEMRGPLADLRDGVETSAEAFRMLIDALTQKGGGGVLGILGGLTGIASMLTGGATKKGLGNLSGIFGILGGLFSFDTAEQDMRPRRWGWDFAAAFGQGLDSGMSQILAPARRRAERAAAGALAGRGDTHITVYNYGDLHRDVEVEAIGSSVASIFRRTLATT